VELSLTVPSGAPFPAACPIMLVCGRFAPALAVRAQRRSLPQARARAARRSPLALSVPARC